MSLFRGRFRMGRRAPGRSWLSVMWYDFGCLVCELYLRLLHRFRMEGTDRVPESGALILVSNHQSYLDPVINGVFACRRPYSAIATRGLTKFKPFGWLLKSWDTVFVSASAGDKGALKAAISQLEQGRTVLIYPEGSRTDDGFVKGFQNGLLLVLRRSRATVLPVGIDGAYEVWPRSRKFPRLSGRIASVCGEPIPADELLGLDGPEALRRLRGEIDTLRLRARRILREQTGGRWPPAGPNDGPSPDA
ncbi:MAG: lysophospholipid acyltransferase family protein [Planctomycetota bacterium]|nr:lysophospholipid acyltransferase family protein [Planctomycetota bacterium]